MIMRVMSLGPRRKITRPVCLSRRIPQSPITSNRHLGLDVSMWIELPLQSLRGLDRLF
jgi:hypothetical protein